MFQTTHTTTKLYTRLARGAPLLSRRILRVVVLLTLRTQIGRTETKEQTFRKFKMNTKPQSNQDAMFASYHRCVTLVDNDSRQRTR